MKNSVKVFSGNMIIPRTCLANGMEIRMQPWWKHVLFWNVATLMWEIGLRLVVANPIGIRSYTSVRCFTSCQKIPSMSKIRSVNVGTWCRFRLGLKSFRRDSVALVSHSPSVKNEIRIKVPRRGRKREQTASSKTDSHTDTMWVQ